MNLPEPAMTYHGPEGEIGYYNATQVQALVDRINELEAVEPMTEVADRFAHRLALALECVLFDKDQPTTRWWDEAMQLIGEYRGAMNVIHEQHSPTFMGEPAMKESL